jgi:shikimate kinase
MRTDYVSAEAYATASIAESGMLRAAFALDLKTKASANLREDRKIVCRDASAKKVAKDVLKLLGHSCGVDVKVESGIPEDLGFGEDEACAAATALAVAGAVAKRYGTVNELKIDIHMSDQFMVVDKKLVNKKTLLELCAKGLRLERVYASFYGGFAVADNTEKKILRHGEMETLQATVLLPKKKAKAPDLSLLSSQLDIISQEALKGNLNTAMNMQSSLLAREAASKMLASGALAVSSSNGGGLVALTREEKKAAKAAKEAKKLGKIISTKPMNEHAKILITPKRIYRINDFMALKGDQPYDWM